MTKRHTATYYRTRIETSMNMIKVMTSSPDTPLVNALIDDANTHYVASSKTWHGNPPLGSIPKPSRWRERSMSVAEATQLMVDGLALRVSIHLPKAAVSLYVDP